MELVDSLTTLIRSLPDDKELRDGIFNLTKLEGRYFIENDPNGRLSVHALEEARLRTINCVWGLIANIFKLANSWAGKRVLIQYRESDTDEMCLSHLSEEESKFSENEIMMDIWRTDRHRLVDSIVAVLEHTFWTDPVSGLLHHSRVNDLAVVLLFFAYASASNKTLLYLDRKELSEKVMRDEIMSMLINFPTQLTKELVRDARLSALNEKIHSSRAWSGCAIAAYARLQDTHKVKWDTDPIDTLTFTRRYLNYHPCSPSTTVDFQCSKRS